ncbi:hypothetical protein L3Q82_020121 [Scortum barcoo]|uniref:Uncharacterized protein n=1 Tax=Scortum barcoo TaxID=214431 RepID=A0ACB8VDL7_9TELE|nr:hypothetical protein L3Q82_020121 [Scortum barcoo]
MMGGKSSALAAGVCGALLLGYCIYFDRKRRSDPNFKNRLREQESRRRLKREGRPGEGEPSLPDLKDAEAVQKFFLEEIQLGEELLAQGDYEKGVDHLTNAIAVCGQPQQLLQVLQQTLPPPVFQMLLTKLPTISQVGHSCRLYYFTFYSLVFNLQPAQSGVFLQSAPESLMKTEFVNLRGTKLFHKQSSVKLCERFSLTN